VEAVSLETGLVAFGVEEANFLTFSVDLGEFGSARAVSASFTRSSRPASPWCLCESSSSISNGRLHYDEVS
jgi:hypothetical protein